MVKRINNPRVSVVIPTYNRANELRRCLDSLRAQTVSDFEVLVCDDGSTDDTAEVVKSYATFLDVTYDYAENFGGPANPRNRGIRLSRAPYIAFLDSDDWWEPVKLEKSICCLDDGADVVFHDLWNVMSLDQKVFKARIRSQQPVLPLFVNLLCAGISMPNSSIVVRANTIRLMGDICEDKELIAVEDFDTLLRLSRITEKFVRIPECLGFYWNGGGNISGASIKQIKRTEAVYKRHLNELSESDRKRAEAFLAYRSGRIAQLCGDWNTAVPYLLTAIRSCLGMKYKIKALWLLSVRRVQELM